MKCDKILKKYLLYKNIPKNAEKVEKVDKLKNTKPNFKKKWT